MPKRKDFAFSVLSIFVFVIGLAFVFFMCQLCNINYKTIILIAIPMLAYYFAAKCFEYGTKNMLPLKEEYVLKLDEKTPNKIIVKTLFLSMCVSAPHYLSWIIMSLVPLKGFFVFMTIFPAAFISGFSFLTLGDTVGDITKQKFHFWLIQVIIFVVIFTAGKSFAFSMNWAEIITL